MSDVKKQPLRNNKSCREKTYMNDVICTTQRLLNKIYSTNIGNKHHITNAFYNMTIFSHASDLMLCTFADGSDKLLYESGRYKDCSLRTHPASESYLHFRSSFTLECMATIRITRTLPLYILGLDLQA